ncbi:MAG: OadG family protein [Prevotella sp.]|nr:OadG family protein [Prevotella sp.]
MNRIRLLLSVLVVAVSSAVFGQGARNIVISEVMTNNTQSIVDEFGQHEAWIELANTSFSTYNVRGMFIATDKSVLQPMSAPERISRMSMIPSGEDRTAIGARKHLVLYCNSNPAKGKLHLAAPLPMAEPVWIALYNGNGVELIDSVTVPALAADQSYARHGGRWSVKSAEHVTPGISNFIEASESKIDKFKREDPHGFAMAIMAMGIVFTCLAALWIFFTIFGMIMRRLSGKSTKAAARQASAENDGVGAGATLPSTAASEHIDMELYMAVIGMALRQYEDNVHDVESGIITIRPKDTGWDDEYSQMTHFHEAITPTDHSAPRIPINPQSDKK